MTEGKSQLDLYRIDRVTTLNEMAEKGVLQNEKLGELYDLEKIHLLLLRSRLMIYLNQ